MATRRVPKKSPVIRTYAESMLTAALKNESTRLILLDGPRGCGKSYFIRQYIDNHSREFEADDFIIAADDANYIQSKDDLVKMFNGLNKQVQLIESKKQRKQHTILFLDNMYYSPFIFPMLVYIMDVSLHSDFKIVLVFDKQGVLSLFRSSVSRDIIRLLESYYDTTVTIPVNTDLLSSDGTVNYRVFEEILNSTPVDDLFMSTFKGRLNLTSAPKDGWRSYAYQLIQSDYLPTAEATFSTLRGLHNQNNFVKLKIALKTYYTLAPFALLSKNTSDKSPLTLLYGLICISTCCKDTFDKYTTSSDKESSSYPDLIALLNHIFTKVAPSPQTPAEKECKDLIQENLDQYVGIINNLCTYLSCGYCDLDRLCSDLRIITSKFN